MGLISIGGLGSGLDVTAIIDALVNAERAPKENSLNRLEADVTVTLTGLGGLKGALDELRTSALDLSLSSSFDKRLVSLSSSEFYTASAASGAAAAEYNIEVTSVAASSFHQSKVFTGGSTTTFGTGGTLTFTVGSETFDIAVSSTDTLADISDNINAATDNSLVTSNLLNNVTLDPDTGSVLNFDSSTLGLGNDLVVTYSGDAALADLSTGLTQTVTAADAGIIVDGFSASSSTNNFTDIISNVTIDVTKVNASSGDTEKLTVTNDTESTKTLITDFVDVYNAVAVVTKQLGSAETGATGILLGDFTLRQVTSEIRNLLSTTISEVTGEFDSLSSIGITTTVDGQLEIDDTILSDAITSDFDQFDELFSGDNGFATQLREMIDGYTSFSGIIATRETSLNEQLSRIADERLTLELKIEKLQFRLTNQFAVMDAAVAQFNSTQSFIVQQFENLPGFGNNKK